MRRGGPGADGPDADAAAQHGDGASGPAKTADGPRAAAADRPSAAEPRRGGNLALRPLDFH